MEITACTFNNKGFPKMSRADVNEGDLLVRDEVSPDFLMEQERWLAGQLEGFRRIFRKEKGYYTYTPARTLVSGTIVARKIGVSKHLASFSIRGHAAVPFVCSYRCFTGQRVQVMVRGQKKQLLYITVHPTPNAWSNKYKDGSRRKKAAQKAWYAYMHALRIFVQRHVENGVDYVIIGGDFNAKPDKVYEIFQSAFMGQLCQTFTCRSTMIDHIIVIGNIKVLRTGNTADVPSDHDPFWALLQLN